MGSSPRRAGPQPTATSAAATCPVSQIAPDLYLVVTRAEAVRVMEDDQAFSGRHRGGPPLRQWTLFQATPDDHAVRRRIVAEAISTRRVARVVPEAHRQARLLVRAFLPHGHAELMAELATPLTGDVVGRMLGIDPNRPSPPGSTPRWTGVVRWSSTTA